MCSWSTEEKDCARAHKVERVVPWGTGEEVVCFAHKRRVVSGTQENGSALGTREMGNLMSFGHAFQEKKVPAFFL